MRVLLVINPFATSYDPHRRRVIEKALGAGHDVEVIETARHGHGLPIAQGAVTAGADAVVVWGGDGMVNEAANGLAGTNIGLGIIPGGSTSVTARTLGIPRDPTEAASRLLDWLDNGRTRRIGLGRIGEHHFTFVAGLGFDAAVVREVEARGNLKRVIGPGVFVAASLAVFKGGFDRHEPKIRFRFDDGEVSPPLFMAIVANSSPYTYLGNMELNMTPRAEYNRPLEILGFTEVGFVRTMRTIVAAFRGGKKLAVSPYVYQRSISHAVMEGVGPIDVQADGEYRGTYQQVEFAWVPQCLTVYA